MFRCNVCSKRVKLNILFEKHHMPITQQLRWLPVGFTPAEQSHLGGFSRATWAFFELSSLWWGWSDGFLTGFFGKETARGYKQVWWSMTWKRKGAEYSASWKVIVSHWRWPKYAETCTQHSPQDDLWAWLLIKPTKDQHKQINTARIQASKQGTKQARNQTSKEPNKQGTKQATKQKRPGGEILALPTVLDSLASLDFLSWLIYMTCRNFLWCWGFSRLVLYGLRRTRGRSSRLPARRVLLACCNDLHRMVGVGSIHCQESERPNVLSTIVKKTSCVLSPLGKYLRKGPLCSCFSKPRQICSLHQKLSEAVRDSLCHLLVSSRAF